MNNQPLISIIVPCYNVEQYLETCVNSVLNQTNPNWELILVDDGSSDNTPSLCDHFSRMDTRIKVIHKKMEVWFLHEMQDMRRSQGYG